jgi:acetyltransferase
MPVGLRVLFEPRSLVVVGASELKKDDELYSKQFSLLVKNLSEFKGKIRIVDLSGKLLGSENGFGKIPKGIDLAVVALPKTLLVKNLRKILGKANGLVLVSDEVEPKQLGELSDLSKRRRLALLGPASLGVFNTEINLAAAISKNLEKGEIAIISQNRDITATIVNQARALGKGVSKVACTGDKVGVDEVDLINYLAADKKTGAICLHVEKPRNSRKLIETIRTVTKEKPILVLKSGRVEKIFESAVRQARGIWVRGVREMLEAADILSKQPIMRGKRVTIVTNFRGQGDMAQRYLEDNGLSVVGPSEEVAKKLVNKHRVKVGEFIDVGVSAKADQYRSVLDELLSGNDADGVLVICVTGLGHLTVEELPKIMEKGKKSKEMTVVGVAPFLEERRDISRVLQDMRAPMCNSVGMAAVAFRVSNTRHEFLSWLEKQAPKSK